VRSKRDGSTARPCGIDHPIRPPRDRPKAKRLTPEPGRENGTADGRGWTRMPRHLWESAFSSWGARHPIDACAGRIRLRYGAVWISHGLRRPFRAYGPCCWHPGRCPGLTCRAPLGRGRSCRAHQAAAARRSARAPGALDCGDSSPPWGGEARRVRPGGFWRVAGHAPIAPRHGPKCPPAPRR